MSNDNHFRIFAKSLEQAIDRYGGMDEVTLVERQKQQIETLVALEKEFRKVLINHCWGPGVYRAFIYKIIHDERNILAARPYFRERQDVFTEKIAKALKKEREKSLYKFHFNYRFVQFAVKQRKWPKRSKIMKLAEQIRQLRSEIVEMNMPLAISRARIFWSRTPKAHLTYMDLIQISCEGLMSAVDKFCLPYSKVFRSVAIGRMVGNFIENYSETLIHFYPQDKRKIYRANKVMHKYGDLESADFEKLAEEVNERADGRNTDASEISGLLSAASHLSIDSTPPDEEKKEAGVGDVLARYPADEDCRPDVMCEQADLHFSLRDAFLRLTLKEQKLLRLKGFHP